MSLLFGEGFEIVEVLRVVGRVCLAVLAHVIDGVIVARAGILDEDRIGYLSGLVVAYCVVEVAIEFRYLESTFAGVHVEHVAVVVARGFVLGETFDGIVEIQLSAADFGYDAVHAGLRLLQVVRHELGFHQDMPQVKLFTPAHDH